jgi:hypothetical protein
LDLPPRPLERYLTENIQYDLSDEYLEGLRLYYQKAARHGLVPEYKPLVFADYGTEKVRSVLNAQTQR